MFVTVYQTLYIINNILYCSVRVAPDAFFGLGNLTELDLSHNLIMFLPVDVFRGLTNLKVFAVM